MMMSKKTGIYFRIETSDGKVKVLSRPEAFTYITSLSTTLLAHRIDSKHELGFKHYIL
jgi:hypothetical protein